MKDDGGSQAVKVNIEDIRFIWTIDRGSGFPPSLKLQRTGLSLVLASVFAFSFAGTRPSSLLASPGHDDATRRRDRSLRQSENTNICFYYCI